jgi:hypothetical protein
MPHSVTTDVQANCRCKLETRYKKELTHQVHKRRVDRQGVHIWVVIVRPQVGGQNIRHTQGYSDLRVTRSEPVRAFVEALGKRKTHGGEEEEKGEYGEHEWRCEPRRDAQDGEEGDRDGDGNEE